MKLKNKTVVVTGGGSGMGQQLALQLLNKRAQVAIADINEEGMEETRTLAEGKNGSLSTHRLDISDQEQVAAFPQKVLDAHGAVDGLINNAGIIQPFIPVHELGFDKIDRIMNINFYGTLYMTKAFLPYLLHRPVAHIANVSSMGGFIPFPGQTLYGASKAGVKLLTEGLHVELKDTPVRVTLLLPGAVNTNIMSNSGVTGSGDIDGKNSPMLQADKAAQMMLKAIEKDRYRKLIGKDAQMLDLLYRLSPSRASNFIAKKMKQQ